MVCDKCAAREKAESQERATCQQERKRLDVQSKRLTIMLTVLSTIVGKEVLDEAMGIFNTVGEVTQVAAAEPPAPSGFDGSRSEDMTLLTSMTFPDGWEPMPNSYLPRIPTKPQTCLLLFRSQRYFPKVPLCFWLSWPCNQIGNDKW